MLSWPEIRSAALLYEDEGILVLNKPPGVSVMGERHESDLVELAAECGERLFPVHRIDKVTSGVILFAKDLATHAPLTRQFNRQSVGKVYLAITRSTGVPEVGEIDLPLSVGRKNRVRVAGNREDIGYDADAGRWSLAPGKELPDKKNYPSRTAFVRVAQTGRNSLLAVRPVSGRRHQIRVHLAWTGHPIEGDPLFDKESAERGGATCLHSWRLAFDTGGAQAEGGRRLELVAAPPATFRQALADFAETPEELLARAEEALPRLPAPEEPADAAAPARSPRQRRGGRGRSVTRRA